MHVSRQTLADLEWDALREHLSSFAHSPLGKERARALGFLADKAAAEKALDAAGEALHLLMQDKRLGLHDLFDVAQELGAARRGGVLPGIGLLNVAVICRTIVAARMWAFGITGRTPKLKALAATLVDVRPLLQELETAIDHNGELRDEASPELKQLRERALALHDELFNELERLLVKLDDQGLLSDRFVSLRNDRFVIPVKASMQHDVPGLLHDASHSGFTVFVEPEHIIERGNKLKLMRVRIVEEEQRILRELSQRVAEQADELEQAVVRLAELDLTFAKGALAQRLQAERPTFATRLSLDKARHPLLVLQKPDVVANHIGYEREERCLVLTGPNTGGKTASLKTAGIICLMARAGLFVPAREGSQIPLFEGIYSVIGDNQSLTGSLSTFSSHIQAVRALFDGVVKHKQGESLVLLDELAADTDPRLGAALGQAILERLVSLGAWVMVTTHYFDLAALPAKDARFANASFGFDADALTPTYKLQRGVPGASSPFEIALNLGLEKGVIERARELAPNVGQGLELLMRQVEARLREVDAHVAETEQARRDADRLREEAAYDRRVAGEERQEAERRAAAALGDELKNAQAQVREAVKRLQEGLLSKKSDMTTRDAMQLVERTRGEIQAAGEVVAKHLPQVPQTPADEMLKVGDFVHAAGLPKDAVGEIMAIDLGKREATVSLGKLRMRLPLADLHTASAKKSALKETPRPKTKAQEASPAAAGDRVDVRGTRVDEALRSIDRALDAAMKEARPELVIMHGAGTGALRNAIREYLSFSHYVRSYRPGKSGEGEDSVTVVEL